MKSKKKKKKYLHNSISNDYFSLKHKLNQKILVEYGKYCKQKTFYE